MISPELGQDLLSFTRPVLVLGDPFQLPPVYGAPFFTAGEPDVVLTQIHRQALESPVLRLATAVREGRRLVADGYGESEVVRRADFDPERILLAEQILVGKNKTRKAYNNRLRERRGLRGAWHEELPIKGDKLVCLRNRHEKGLLNGSIWTVGEMDYSPFDVDGMRLSVFSGADIVQSLVRPECFTGGLDELDWKLRSECDEFDFGYVLTVHKSQGSQWTDVVLFDESSMFGADCNRWLYTGITRAANRITVVVS
jgi:exodeoxyribonuclease-5